MNRFIIAGSRYIMSILLLFFFLPLLVSCRDTIDLPKEKHEVARNMVFVYMMAENSLSSYASDDLEEMLRAAESVPDDCYMMAFVDDCGMPRVCRFYNKSGVGVCDTIVRFGQDFCSSDIDNMKKVVEDILDVYPAETLDVVMWSHGNGWIRANRSNAPMKRSIGVDNGRNSYSNTSTEVIEMEELAKLLESLPAKVRMVMFDACFMQTIEVAYALRNSAEWIVASPAEIPADGAPYHLIMKPLFARQFDVADIINGYISAYNNQRSGALLSAVRCEAIEELTRVTAKYIPLLFPADSIYSVENLFSYLPGGYFGAASSSSSASYYPDYFDMNMVMKERLSAGEYSEWHTAFCNAVPCFVSNDSWYSAIKHKEYRIDRQLCGGISMYIPQHADMYQYYNGSFATTEWYRAAGWGGAGW